MQEKQGQGIDSPKQGGQSGYDDQTGKQGGSQQGDQGKPGKDSVPDGSER
jgi:hypothetical protein